MSTQRAVTTQHTLTRHNALELADSINRLHASGLRVLINGDEVHTMHRQAPASSWGTGSVSVLVRGRTPRKQGTAWIKTGQTLTLTVKEN